MSASSSLLLLLHSVPSIHPKSRPNPNPNSSIPTFFSIKLRPLSIQSPIPLPLRRKPVFSAAYISGIPAAEPRAPPTLLSHWTRTLSSLLSLALAASRFLHVRLLPQLGGSLSSAAGPAFFAALKDRPSGYLNTALTVVAAGLAKWLDIYSGVLMVRVLLSWFPLTPHIFWAHVYKPMKDSSTFKHKQSPREDKHVLFEKRRRDVRSSAREREIHSREEEARRPLERASASDSESRRGDETSARAREN